NGAGPLQVSVTLQNSSQWMSNDMATHNYASHTDSLGRDPGTRLAAFGYSHVPWGENIAGGFGDAQNALNQWANACDPDASGNCTYAHRKNMLNPSFVAIGIGRVYNGSSSYGWYWTTDFGGFLDQAISPGQTTNPPPNPTPAPAIGSFSASPANITAGQSTTLSWSVSGATTISIDNGLGTVTGNSKSVSPVQTTTYTLTATNSSGTISARVTVTVNAASDTQAPTAPTITSAVAKSSTEIDLAWTASSDNIGVAGYQVLRNGIALTAVNSSTVFYADTSAAPGTAYAYSVRAYDAAKNYSIPSNTAQVSTSAAAPVSSSCPAAA